MIMPDNLEVGKVINVVEAGNEGYSLTVFDKTFTPFELLQSSIQGLGYILFLGTSAGLVYLALREKPIKGEMDHLRKDLIQLSSDTKANMSQLSSDTKANMNQLSAKQDAFLKELIQLKVDVAVNSNTLKMMGSIPPMAPTPPGGNGDVNGKKGEVDGPPKFLQSSIIPPPNQVWKMAGRALVNARRLLKR